MINQKDGAEPKRSGRGGKRAGAGRKKLVEETEIKSAYVLFHKSRAQRESHQAKLAELELKRRRGLLLDARKVRLEADAAGRSVRNAFLALPDRLASLLVGRSEEDILNELRKEIRATLETLSNELSGPPD